MNVHERRASLRRLLEGDSCFHPGSVYDPISARIAESLGFEVGMLAGSTASLTVLGAPDLVLLTLTEFAEQARRVCRACTTLPVLVDANHGYGNALNAARTVEELEAAGVAGLTIEDTILPTPFDEIGKASLLSIAEGAGKLKAAVAARQDPFLTIVGRTSAISISGLDDALERAKAYEATGVNAMFFSGVRTRADLDALFAATRLPIILGNPGHEVVDLHYLATRRVRICLQGHTPIMAATQAVYDTLRALREGVSPSKLQGIASDAMMQRVSHSKEYDEMMHQLLRTLTTG